MDLPIRFLLLVKCILLVALLPLSTCTQCYYPDGSESSDTPCSTTGTNSACCSSSAYCLSNNLCMWDMLLARGSCTDSTFTAAECPNYCKNVLPSGGNTMTPCSNTLWTCVHGACAQSNFTVASASIVLRKDQISSLKLATTVTATKTATAAGSTVSVTSMGTTTATVTATLTATSTATCSASPQAIITTAPANSTSTSSLAAVGAGVGGPLAIVAAAALALLFRERRQSERLRLENEQILAARRDNEPKAMPIRYVSEARQPQELMGHQPPELMGSLPTGMTHRMD